MSLHGLACGRAQLLNSRLRKQFAVQLRNSYLRGRETKRQRGDNLWIYWEELSCLATLCYHIDFQLFFHTWRGELNPERHLWVFFLFTSSLLPFSFQQFQSEPLTNGKKIHQSGTLLKQFLHFFSWNDSKALFWAFFENTIAERQEMWQQNCWLCIILVPL